MKTWTTVCAHVEPDSNTPTRGAGIRQRLRLALPAVPPEPFQLVSHNLRLKCAGRLRSSKRQIATPGAVGPGDRTQRPDPVGRRVDHLESLCVPIRATLRGHPRPHSFTGQRIADENHPALVVRHAATAVRGRSGDQRQIHCIVAGAGHWRRSSPSLCSASSPARVNRRCPVACHREPRAAVTS
ncbi:Uncharacterised protein [Mycobacterium tuberculosis]|nr:Uncharacterised protein [Mycobacterium tuberculosis]